MGSGGLQRLVLSVNHQAHEKHPVPRTAIKGFHSPENPEYISDPLMIPQPSSPAVQAQESQL